MPSTSKVLTLALAAALLAHPLAGVAAWWQQGTARATCPTPCSMPQEPSTADPLVSAAAGSSCCQISSTAPAPQARTIKAQATNLL
ncbi:MAG: hypothetical protein ACE1Z8_01300, partial [Candidatus Acidiferrales bacterium]